MEKQLPKNWVELQLIDLLEVFENGSRPKGGVQGILEGVPSLGGEHLNDNRGFKFEKIKYIPEQYAEKLHRGLIKKDDILIVKDGATTGKSSYVDENFPFEEAFVNEHVFICRTYPVLNSKSIFYFIYSNVGKNRILENFTGAAQGGINRKFASNTLIPLPPLPEQDRIVAKLDSLFAELDTIKERLANIPTLLKNFRQSVLNQAVTGKLTEEWRKGKDLESFKLTKPEKKYRDFDLQLPEYWKIFSFESIANINSNLKDPKDYLNHVLVAPNHIEKNTGILTQIEYTRDIKPKSDKHFFRQGSIIYSKIRPYLNKVILADFDGLCSADMYPITSEIKREYLFYYMLSSVFLSYATTAGERSVLPKINQKSLNIIPVPVPSLKEQTEIVKRVETLFKQADNIQAHYEALVKCIEVLPQTILAKAFKGELVQQLPTDGDAKELLEEIKKLKEVATPKKKKRTVKK